MKHKFLLIVACFFVVLTACKKSKIKKKIAGKWLVTAMYTEDADLLNLTKKGKFYTTLCDTVFFERKETQYCELVCNENERYIRTKKITIQYMDTAASRIQCKAVYADSVMNSVEEGTWRFEGKETLELLADNNNYEGNKLVTITDKEMVWQTDLTVEQGIVLFTGFKTTKFAKQ